MQNRRIKGFTLAEVLIALVVIGIIAAITLTTVMPNIQERANSMRQVNVVRKITQATDEMRAQGSLTQFSTTMDFVNEFKKHIKIVKICDSNHISECWPTQKVIDRKGEEYTVSDAKTRKDLAKDNSGSVPNVGVVLADGAALIMTYDPSDLGISLGNQLSTSNINLPVGFGKTENFSYTTNSTKGLSFVFDVNGGRGKNSETLENSSKRGDIISFNGAHFGSGCSGAKIDGKCYFWAESIPTPIDCTNTSGVDYIYCNNSQEYSNDYWAGANKYCKENGGNLVDYTKLISLSKQHGIGDGYNCRLEPTDGVITSIGTFWATYSSYVNLSGCYGFSSTRNYGYPKAFCVGN